MAVGEAQGWAASGLLLVAPWLFFSIFAGMGAPPATPAAWVASAFAQQLRYSFLLLGGALLLAGFTVLHDKLRGTPGNLFSSLGYAALLVAIPLFLLNMSYWHSFVLQAFKIMRAGAAPAWLEPVKKLFLVVAITEVSLIYFATAAFAAALRSAAWLSRPAARVSYVLSLPAGLLVACYGLYPAKLVASGFPFYPFIIPAIPFVIPFYIGVALLRRAGGTLALPHAASSMPA